MVVEMECFGGRIIRIADRKYRTESFFTHTLASPRWKTYTPNFSDANGHPLSSKPHRIHSRMNVKMENMHLRQNGTQSYTAHTQAQSGVFIKKKESVENFMSRQKLKL